VKGFWSLPILLLLGSQAWAQQQPSPIIPQPIVDADFTAPACEAFQNGSSGGRLSGTHDFPNFIGFMSNPLQNIDPRALTEIYPIFGSVWTHEAGPVPAADFQLYGAGLTVALSDRFAAGLNQGGYVDVHLTTNDRQLLTAVDAVGRQKVLNLFQQNPAALLALLRQHGANISDLARLARLLSFDPQLNFESVEIGGNRGG
jgi:hypothetical protein